jgi:hypothetical protein
VRLFVQWPAPEQYSEAGQRHVGRHVGQGSILLLQLQKQFDAIFAK